MPASSQPDSTGHQISDEGAIRRVLVVSWQLVDAREAAGIASEVFTGDVSGNMGPAGGRTS